MSGFVCQCLLAFLPGGEGSEADMMYTLLTSCPSEFEDSQEPIWVPDITI